MILEIKTGKCYKINIGFCNLLVYRTDIKYIYITKFSI
jgi:hypothetical protein